MIGEYGWHPIYSRMSLPSEDGEYEFEDIDGNIERIYAYWIDDHDSNINIDYYKRWRKIIPNGVAVGSDGKVIMTSSGEPQHMKYAYGYNAINNGSGYNFQGGDAIYEDVNGDGNIDQYDVVYLGTPVWASKSATPPIAYIKQNEGKFKNVKFFATSAGGGGFDSTFLQLEKFTNVKPQATLGLTSKDVKKDLYLDQLADFIRG